LSDRAAPVIARGRPGEAGGTPWSVDDTVRLLAAGRTDYRLTDEQRAAVGAPLAPGLVLAGAGSGKTEVMAARVVHLVAAGFVLPEQVLGLTFTVKATASLAARIRTGLGRLRDEWRTAGERGQPATGPSALDGEPTVSTYNGYGARLVAEQGLRLGIEPGSRLATEGMRWQLALRVVRQWSGQLDVDVQPTTVAERLRTLAGELADHLCEPDAVRAAHTVIGQFLSSAPRQSKDLQQMAITLAVREQLLRLVEEYERHKRRNLLLDYGDQIALAGRLAGLPAVRAAERAQFRVVLLDEYQDTGVAQRVLLQRLFGAAHPVTAVGDPAQSIYAFRGASVGNIVRFPEHFPQADGTTATVYPLLTNFRSGGAVLAVANAIAGGLPARGSVPSPVLRPRPGRELTGAAGRGPAHVAAEGEGADGEAGTVRVALLPDAEQEAAWVRDRILAAAGRRATAHAASCQRPGCAGWHEVAVLCRKRSQFGLLRQALEGAAVPVEVVGLGGLLDAPEVADIVAVLRVLHDPTRNADLVRLLTGARLRIGPRDLDALGRRARLLAGTAGGTPAADDASAEERTSALLLAAVDAGDQVDVGALADTLEQLDDPRLQEHAPLSPEAYQRLQELREMLAGLRRRAGQPLPDLVADVERVLGLDIELEATPRAVARGRRANVLAFLDVAADFVGVEGETHLGAFLASLEAAERAEDGYDMGTPSPADAVKLMTVHAAKGLEWDVVCVPGLCAGTQASVFPSGRGSPRWPHRPDVLPWHVRGDRDDLPQWKEPSPGGYQAYVAACVARDGEEERRLAYVAVTRARSVLLCSGYWWGPTAKSRHVPSPFLLEATQACIDGAGVAEPPAPPPEGENPLLAASLAREVNWPPAPEIDPAVAAAAQQVRRLMAAAESSHAGDGHPTAVATAALTLEQAALVDAWRRDAELLLRERRTRGHPTTSVPVPDTLSVSDLVTVANDPAQLAERVARPMPQPPAPAARRGTAFHSWAEARSGRRALLETEEVPGAGDAGASGGASRLPLEALQAAFLSSPYGRREPLEVEVGFELVLGGHLVRGRMDAVYPAAQAQRTFEDLDLDLDLDDFDVEVVDYKTGARPTGAVARAAAVQLACYREAWAEISGTPADRVGAAFFYVADTGQEDGGVVRPPLPSRDELVALLDGLPVAKQD